MIASMPLPLSPPVPGSEFAELWAALASQYAVERELGRGGMGVVFLARDIRLDRFVAIKVLPPHLALDPDVRERFLREARTAGRLSHPNIVPVFRADELSGHPFFAMPYIEGEHLGERVSARGPLSPGEAVRYLREVAWALAYAHARGVIHRDVKPENIMVERGTGRAIVTDFGIARVEYAPGMTHEGLIVGTANYMSPEQVNGEALDGRSDLYALGVVGFLLLSGRLPFSSESVSALLVAHVSRPPPSLASVAPGVPLPIATVIDRCLAKERDARYPTGESLADALEKALRTSDLVPLPEGSNAGSARTLSDRQASAVWRRAAALQVAALEQFEERLRDHALQRGIDAVAGPPFVDGSVSPDGIYAVRDVEAAAAAAGISGRYVALALAELAPSSDAHPSAATSTPVTRDRLTKLVLGREREFLAVSRRIAYVPGRVFQALGRVLQAPPFELALGGTVGGHPLDGGVLLLTLPPEDVAPHAWIRTRGTACVTQLQLTIAAVSGTGGCEVALHADITAGVRSGTRAGAAWSALGGFVAASVGVAAALTTAATGVGMAAWVAGLTLSSLALCASGYRIAYHRRMQRAAAELEHALAAIEAHVQSDELFGIAAHNTSVR